MRTITEIIKAAGGARVVAEALKSDLTKDAVYKWAQIGIPDRHWETVIRLADSSPEELYQANLAARAPNEPAQAEAPADEDRAA